MIVENDIQIVDHWQGDKCAIGIQKNKKLIYTSTYNYLHETIVKYDVDFELIDSADETNISILKKETAVTAEYLIDELKIFFQIA